MSLLISFLFSFVSFDCWSHAKYGTIIFHMLNAKKFGIRWQQNTFCVHAARQWNRERQTKSEKKMLNYPFFLSIHLNGSQERMMQTKWPEHHTHTHLLIHALTHIVCRKKDARICLSLWQIICWGFGRGTGNKTQILRNKNDFKRVSDINILVKSHVMKTNSQF